MRNAADLLTRLRARLARGPASAPELAGELQISQPTFARLWKQPEAEVVALGKARAAVYGLPRPIGDLGSEFPVFRVDEQGRTQHLGALVSLQRDWTAFIPDDHPGRPQLFEGLPFFMHDMRPQGFLGRLVPRQHGDLPLPPDIKDWSDEHVLLYLLRRGEDSFGNLVIGNESYRRFLQGVAGRDSIALTDDERAGRYPLLAVAANKGEIAGSSAGGEQPKFMARIHRKSGGVDHVIVKFSPDGDTPSKRRWVDLLVCEHLACLTLAAHGIDACTSSLLEAGGRMFLEVVRFDRIGLQGRARMVSLEGAAPDLADRPWSVAAAVLATRRRIEPDTLERIRLLDLFGALIGNSDRHPGNLSLSWDARGVFSLLPVYDMLPMMYRPNTQGEIVEREFNLGVVDRIDTRHMATALAMADDFWRRVLDDTRISPDFKDIAQRHLHQMSPAQMIAVAGEAGPSLEERNRPA